MTGPMRSGPRLGLAGLLAALPVVAVAALVLRRLSPVRPPPGGAGLEPGGPGDE